MRRSVLVVFCVGVLSLAFSHAKTAGQAAPKTADAGRAWSTDDIVLAEQASEFQISPDSRWAVWVRSTPDADKDRAVSNLVLSSLTEDKEIPLTRGGDNVSTPKWSPDGRLIAFTMNRSGGGLPGNAAAEQLWLIDPFGGEPWRITSFIRPISDYVWVDNDTIIFSAPEDPSFFETSVKKSGSPAVIEDEEHEPPVRLFKYSIGGKAVTRLTDNTDRIEDFSVAQGGRWAVTVHDRSLRYEYDNRDKPLVFVYDLNTGQRRQILDEKRFNVRDIKWAPDAKGFYISNSFKEDPTYLWAVVTEMYYFDVASGTISKVDLNWARGLAGGFITTRDGFIALLANGARNRPARFVKSGNSWRREWLNGEHVENIFGLMLGADGQTLLYNYSTASKPVQWYRARLSGNRIEAPVRVTNMNERFREKIPARTEIIRWKGALDEEVEGILYYPQDYKEGQKYPLVVMIHGGPTLVDYDAWKETWHYPHNLYTQRGAFVLAPNYHGSSNYGLKWAESIAGGNYYDLEIPDIEKGVDHLIARGSVDPDKLGVLGWSNGSLLTIALTTRTTRYKAAGAGAGTVDWSSDWANAYFGASFNNYYFGKSPLEDPERYVRKSPFYQLDRVRTPTIIFFGEDDRTVAPSQGWMHYRALQQAGKTDVRFIMFPDTGHSLRKLSYQRRKIDEELAWFDKYLFKTDVAKNEALKPESPLDSALKARNIKKTGGRHGLMKGKTIVPETVDRGNIRVGRFEVTRAQYAEFDPTYKFDAGTENFPANNIAFEQAQRYNVWLSRLTGETYRLPTEGEAAELYVSGTISDNTLDYWAGYAVNPDDAVRLGSVIKGLSGSAPLLKAVGSFKGSGEPEPVFDLGGNVAEWVNSPSGPRIAGGSADLPADPRIRDRRPAPEYIGFRVVRDLSIKGSPRQ